MSAILIGFGIFFMTQDPPQSSAPPDLSWMSGTWAGDIWGGRMEEHWTTQAGGTLLGTNRLVRDGKTVHKEFIWIETTAETATLTVHVFREPAETVKYKLTSIDLHTATFQNLEHKRLQTMRYTRAGRELIISLSGLRQSKEFEEEIKLSLVPDK